jgi:hypothetical protein
VLEFETAEFVFVLTPATIDDEAFPTTVFVFELTDEMTDEPSLFVLALTDAVPADIAEASEVDAFVTAVLTFEIAVAIEDDADVTSDCNASVPEVSVPAVSVRVPNDQTSAAVKLEPPPIEPVANTFPIVPAVVKVDVATFQTSDANVPNDVRVREADDQTARGIVAANEVEAVRTVALVLALIVVTAAAI